MRTLTAIKLGESLSITMLFLSTMEIQQDSGRGFPAGRTALRTRASRISQKQRGQALDQGLSVQVARQQVQGVVFDGIEGDRPVDRLGMTGFSRIELGLCRLGQNRFQAGQVHDRMKVLPDGCGPEAREIFQVQAGLEYAIEGFDIPSLMPL